MRLVIYESDYRGLGGLLVVLVYSADDVRVEILGPAQKITGRSSQLWMTKGARLATEILTSPKLNGGTCKGVANPRISVRKAGGKRRETAQ